MHLAFLVNKHLTMAYADLAAQLEARGHTIFWISPSRRWSQWLEASGWSRARILNLPELGPRWRAMPADAARASLAPLEPHGPLAIGNVILMDRAMRRRSSDAACAILATVADAIRRFLIEHRIDVCVGEATWAWELVTWLVCRTLGRPCLAFTTVRIPSDRFAFFESATHQILEHRTAGPADHEWARRFLAEYRARPRPPGYAVGQLGALRFRRHWGEELRRAVLHRVENRDDITLWPLRARIRHRLRLAGNALQLRLVPPFERAAVLPADRRFVLFCLHHQPEASIDVVAALHSDQAAAIERLVRVLPATHELWVKEHINGIGDRSRRWLERIARLPGVRLIDPHESTFALIGRADLVVSPAGTVAYEAALLGRPAATLGTLYFSRLMAACGDPSTWALEAVLGRSGATPDAELIQFLAWLHAQSFSGFPDRLAGAAMAAKRDLANEAAVLAGFETVLAHLAVPAPALAHAEAP